MKPETFSFTCKDGVDVGATMSTGFLVLIKLLSDNPQWLEEEKKHLLWVLNGGALKIRERLVDYQRLSRMLSALSILTENISKGGSNKVLESLFSDTLFQKIYCEFS